MFERGPRILDATNGEQPDQIDDAIAPSSFDAMFDDRRSSNARRPLRARACILIFPHQQPLPEGEVLSDLMLSRSQTVPDQQIEEKVFKGHYHYRLEHA